jgi:AcrR family transcriptional regulator
MPPRRAAAEEINAPLQAPPKPSQRERLLSGMVTAANRDGYAGASVSRVIAEAGVSRPTFYEQFEDRETCFLAATQSIQERLLHEIRDHIKKAAPEDALSAAVRATVRFAASEPADARFLMKETLAGGPGALDARDQGLRDAGRLIEKTFNSAAAAKAPELPAAAALGAIQRLLASRLRRGERALAPMEEELVAWVESYRGRARSEQWHKLRRLRAPERSPYLPRTSLRAPPRLPAGRIRVSEEEVLENQRQRIIFATAQVVQERGYSAAKISEILKHAGVDGRRFYRLFADKQEAFGAIHELGFQFLMAASAGAFFAGANWPERIWEAFRAATQSIDDTPAFAHLGFVEAYAVGPRAIQRVEDSRIAFTIFLQEGYRQEMKGDPPSRTALEAIITTIFEIIYSETRASRTPQTAGLLGHIAFIALTPFLGVEASDRFLREKHSGRRAAGKDAKPRKTPAKRPKE